ncbi:Thrombospondin-1 [Exaiptasia diaphana]|nr:Thrombospondin-1 [Exaiptasia diaphana]
MNTAYASYRPGGWGQWSSWSRCSVICGTGIRRRTRNCDNPPPGSKGNEDCESDGRCNNVCRQPDHRIIKQQKNPKCNVTMVHEHPKQDPTLMKG